MTADIKRARVASAEGELLKDDPQIGALFDGRYQIIRALGEGGMGVVFAASDTQRDHLPCAIKVIRAARRDSSAYLARLKREREVMSKLKHPHIIEVFDVQERQSEQHPYLVMELLQGEPFDVWLTAERSRGEVSVSRLVRLLCQALDALEHAHRLNIIHRDIKPDNLFVCRDETGSEQLKLLDFGIAKDHDAMNLTEGLNNAMIGTPRYMPPEQITQSEPVSAASDLYAFCFMLYEALIDAHPFDSPKLKNADQVRGLPTPFRMSWHHVNSAPPPLLELPELWAIIREGFAKPTSLRLSSAQALREALTKWLRRGSAETKLLTPIPLTPLSLDTPQALISARRTRAAALLSSGELSEASAQRQQHSRKRGLRLKLRALVLWRGLSRLLQRPATLKAWLTFTLTSLALLGLTLTLCALLWRALDYPELPLIGAPLEVILLTLLELLKLS